MSREEVVEYMMCCDSDPSGAGAHKYRGVEQTKAGRSKAHITTGGRTVHLVMCDTGVVTARVFDFAALSLRGKQANTNFDKGAYLGADGGLLPVEVALPGLGPDTHKCVRDKIAAAVMGAGGAAEGGSRSGCNDGRGSGSGSGSGSEGDGGGAGPAITTRERTRSGTTALGVTWGVS
ncbi:hypothetical protein FOA52_013130 [Chlamydomonas sp. UWO 241]|nr:hypothetical protein FOA52_013130 [Chlamydomonas sp. UWO 241]